MKVQIVGFELGSAESWDGEDTSLAFYDLVLTDIGKKILSLSVSVEKVDVFTVDFDTGEFELFNDDQEEPFHKGFLNLKIGD